MSLKEILIELKEFKKDNPVEYEILTDVAKKLLNVLTSHDLEALELEYFELSKEEALQFATALIRKTREERTKFKVITERLLYVFTLLFSKIIESQLGD